MTPRDRLAHDDVEPYALRGVRGDILSGVGAHAGVTPGFNVAVLRRDDRDNRSNRSRKRGKLAEQRNSGTAEHATPNRRSRHDGFKKSLDFWSLFV
jgi:hypothetical protein